jgi:predicted cupin superfamily sugar epimerase
MTADEVKQLLQLSPLELEGGFFRETYRSRWQVSAEYLPEGIRGSRSIGTAIYYMITPDTFSTLHRLPGTEVFHFYLGDPVVMLQLHPDGETLTVTLGHDLAAGQQPQVVVRGGVWQGCRLAPDGQWALMGTTMSPGFDYADYETGGCDELIAQYPDMADAIREYTR